MFHVLLALPAIAVFGTVAGAVLAVLLGLLGLAFIVELLCGFVFRTVKWLLWIPLILGAAVFGLLGILFGTLPLTLLLVFSVMYGIVLLMGRCAVVLLRWLFRLII